VATEPQWRFGVANDKGELGLVTDEEEALKRHQKAADGGQAGAQCRLAEAYDGGELSLVTDEERRR